MEIKMLSRKMSDLLSSYDRNLIKRAKHGCLGKTELDCYNRFLDDLEKAESDDFPYFFDWTEVHRVLDFAALLTVYDEKGGKSSLVLYPVQKFIIANLFGWRHKSSKTLRFRESYIQIARRNGKSWLCSLLMHYFCTGSSFRSERGICFSIKKQTAMIAFRQFCQFIDADSDLAALYNYSKVNGTAESLGTDNYIEVFTGSKEADGFQSGYAIGDELALQDGELYRLIKDGQANLPQAQIIGITTAGFKINDWCHKRYKSYKKALEANVLPDNLFLFICEPDENDDIGDWHTWCKANPILFFDQKGRIKQDKIDLYSTEYQEAVKHGGKELNSWITKQCNIWNAKADMLLCDLNKLEESRFDFTFEEVAEQYKNWYLGVDLSQVLDLNSVCYCTWINVDEQGTLLPPKATDGQRRLYVNVINFMPKAQLSNHIQTDKFLYDKYVGGELILTLGGKGLRTDYGEICDRLEAIQNIHGLRYITISCDPYGVSTIQGRLEEMCDTFIMQSQYRRVLSPYIEAIGAMVNSEEIALSKGSSDIFMRAVMNCVVEIYPDGYLAVTKPNGTVTGNFRIDPVDSLLDCIVAPLKDRDKELATADELFDEWQALYE